MSPPTTQTTVAYAGSYTWVTLWYGPLSNSADLHTPTKVMKPIHADATFQAMFKNHLVFSKILEPRLFILL